MSTERQPKKKRQPTELGPLARIGLSVAGVAGMSGGSIAVFTQDVEAGPVAMMAIGALFLVTGVAGVLPTRLKFGDSEIEFSRVEISDALVKMIELIPLQRRPQAIELLQDLVEAAPETATAALRGVAFEDLVLRMLEDAVIELNGDHTANGDLSIALHVSRGGKRFDAVITAPNGSVLGVEVKGYTKPIGPLLIREFEARARKAFSPTEVRFMFVTKSRLTSAAQEYVSRPGATVHHVTIKGSEDQRSLTNELARALQL